MKLDTLQVTSKNEAHGNNNSQGVSDIPAAIFYREFIEAYPNAKIILTSRSEDGWVKSMLNTVWAGHLNPRPDRHPKAKNLSDRYNRFLWDNDFPQYGLEAYRRHNEEVRRLSEGREFIEYNVSEGWEPLCKLLGLQVPEQPFPWTDEAKGGSKPRIEMPK